MYLKRIGLKLKYYWNTVKIVYRINLIYVHNDNNLKVLSKKDIYIYIVK